MNKKASALLKENSLFSYPVDVKKLAKKLKVIVSSEDLEDKVSGFLAVDDDNATIVVNSNHHENRKRFTMAHELGHFVLHKGKMPLFLDTNLKFYRSAVHSEHSAEIEMEANAFAAELLMPKLLIEKIIETYDLDITDEYDNYQLSKKLKVSEQALTIRLVKLELIFPF